ncbi:hypothetical protein BBI15_08210 [Planococcus plakortidis]|uniref:Uncharacterized protein n=1 Tax=Planococcus plakortidis TaxID=1038856 RepID=A0A1C7E8Y8_9BACL|nr:hypothetical protein BBI15_08210 [Planococcus plakortidis]
MSITCSEKLHKLKPADIRLTNLLQEKRERPIWLDRRKADSRSGALCRTGKLTCDPRARPLELDNKKSESACPAPTGIRRISNAAPFAAMLERLMTRGARRSS